MILKNHITKDYIRVIKQFKKYDLFNEVNNLEDFINSLSKRQINNFLNIDIPFDLSKEIKPLLVNKIFLDSKNCINDLSFIKYSINSKQRKALIEVAKNPLSIASIYHQRDMYCIFITYNEDVYDSLVNAATNENSIKNKKHSYYMGQISSSSVEIAEGLSSKLCFPSNDDKACDEELQLILNAKNDDIARALSMVSTDYFSLNSVYHASDMYLIANTKSNVVARYLSYVATNVLSLNSKYHTLDMSALFVAKNDFVASILFHMIIDEEMQNPLVHEKEINYILNAKSEGHLRALCYLIFDSYSRKSPLYLTNLDIIANSDNENFALIAAKDMLNESKRIESNYKLLKKQISDAILNEDNVAFVDYDNNEKVKKINNN